VGDPEIGGRSRDLTGRVGHASFRAVAIPENESDWLIDAVRPLIISNIGNDAAEGEIEWID